jgi:hypothetical protein
VEFEVRKLNMPVEMIINPKSFNQENAEIVFGTGLSELEILQQGLSDVRKLNAVDRKFPSCSPHQGDPVGSS